MLAICAQIGMITSKLWEAGRVISGRVYHALAGVRWQ